MVSNKFFILIGAVLAASLVAAQNYGENSKCKLNAEIVKQDKPLIDACCLEVFKKECDFDASSQKKREMTETETVAMCECMAKKRGLLSEDEKTFNIEQAKVELKKFDMSNETKAQLVKAYDDCASKIQNGKQLLKCVRDITKEICKG